MRTSFFYLSEEIRVAAQLALGVDSLQELRDLEEFDLLGRIAASWGKLHALDPWKQGRRPRSLRVLSALRSVWFSVASSCTSTLNH